MASAVRQKSNCKLAAVMSTVTPITNVPASDLHALEGRVFFDIYNNNNIVINWMPQYYTLYMYYNSTHKKAHIGYSAS